MRGGDIIEVLQQAVEFTGQPTVRVGPGPALLTDSGPDFLDKALEKFLKLRVMKQITASPFHPQTNGKLERCHQSIKHEANQVPYEVPGDLEVTIASFVDYNNNRRYYKALGNMTPDGVLHGRWEGILIKRREVKLRP